MLTRICGSCGRMVEQGRKCPCRADRHKEYDQDHRDKSKARFYNSKQWRAAAAAIRAKAGYADELVKATSHRLVPGTIVHHIQPIDERADLRLELSNLILVSARTHRAIHDTYVRGQPGKRDMQKKLADIVSKRSKGET